MRKYPTGSKRKKNNKDKEFAKKQAKHLHEFGEAHPIDDRKGKQINFYFAFNCFVFCL